MDEKTRIKIMLSMKENLIQLRKKYPNSSFWQMKRSFEDELVELGFNDDSVGE